MSNDLKSKKDKSKKHKSSLSKTSPITDAGKNEGVDQDWAFQPPAGAKAISTNAEVDNGEFDWDTVDKDEDVEVWVLRVPENVKPKHLEGLSLDFPSSPSSSTKGKTARIGTLKRKHMSYDIWSLGEEDTTDTKAAEGEHVPIVGGEELKSLSCLLPRKSKKGRLYLAPKPVARHIIVSAQPPQPSTLDSSSSATTPTNPPRHKYAPELLTHRFMPYGSLVKTDGRSPSPNVDVVMTEVDSNVPEEGEKEGQKSKKKKDKIEKVERDIEMGEPVKEEKKEKKKGKKRKGEDSEVVGLSTKKSKKAKTSS